MKKATLIIWAIILGFIALVIFQNQEFFLTNKSLRINLGVINEYHSPELPIAVLVLIFFFFGTVITYLFNLSTRFKAKRTIKKLNATISSNTEEISGLKNEMNSLKSVEIPAENEKAQMDTTQKIVSEKRLQSPVEQTGEYFKDLKTDNPTKNSEEKSNPNKEKSNLNKD